MKSLKMLLVVTSLSLASAAVLAQPLNFGGKYVEITDYKTLQVSPSTTKAGAYEIARAQLESLQGLNSAELNAELDVWHFNALSNQAHLKEGSNITVKEQMNTAGEVEYIGLVNVEVHYIERESDN